MTGARASGRGVIRLGFAALTAGVLAATAATPAWAVPVTQVVQGQYLRIVSTADWLAAASMAPSNVVPWDLSVSVEAPEPGTVSIGVRATGGTPLVADVLRCDVAWTSGGCTSGTETLRAGWTVPRDDVLVPVLEMTDTDTAHLRLVVGLGPGTIIDSTTIRVQVDGASESVIVGPETPLPGTGADPTLSWLLAAGAGALIVVAVLLIGAGRRRRDPNTGEWL